MNILFAAMLLAIVAVVMVRSRKQKVSAAAITEWVLLLAVSFVVLFFFLKGYGFISTDDIQPYPY